jgi:hypothetical protein
MERRVSGVCAHYSFLPTLFSFFASHDVPSDAAIPTNATGNESFITGGRGQRGTAIRCDSWSSSPPSAHFRAEMADYFLLGSSDVNVKFDYADALSFPSGASISLVMRRRSK